MTASLPARLLLIPLEHRAAALLGTLVITAALASQIPKLRGDVRQEKGFPQSDPRLEVYQLFREKFGADDETAYVLLEMPGSVLEGPAIERIWRISEEVSELAIVDQTRFESLSHAILVRVTEEDGLELAPLYEPRRKAGWDPAAIAALIQPHPAFRDRLISRDQRLAAFLVPLHPSERAAPARRAFAAAIRAFFQARLAPGERLYFEGLALTKWEVLDILAADTRRVLPLVLAALLSALGLLFRRLAPVLIAALAVCVSAIWTLAFMAILDIPVSYISSAVPALVLIFCVGDSVYLMARFDQARAEGTHRRDALRQAVLAVGGACLLANATTAAGFASLLASDLEVIRELGLPVALGVIADFLTTFLIVPPLLDLAPTPPPGQLQGGLAILDAPIARLARAIEARPRAILALALAASLCAAAIAPRISIESRLLEDMDPDAPLIVTRTLFEQRMGGACPLELVITAPSPDRLLTHKVQDALYRLAQTLREPNFQQLGVLSAIGLPDFLVEAHATLAGRRLEDRRIPESERAIHELLLLYEMGRRDPTRGFIDFDRRTLRLHLRVRNEPTGAFFRLADTVAAEARRTLPTDLEVRLTGFPLLTQAAHAALVRALLTGFLLSSAQVIALIALYVRSKRIALLALPSNILPLIFVLATMALAGIPLKLGTSIVFSITLGITVDDTIHFLAALDQQPDRRSPDISRTLRETGSAMVLASLILCLGCLALAASSFRANREFGLLLALTLAYALLTDLVLLPALLHVFWARPNDGVHHRATEATEENS